MDSRPTRRAVLAGAAAFALPLAGCRSGTDDGGTPTPTADEPALPDLELGVTLLAAGLDSPVDTVPLDDGGLLVAEQPGRVVHVSDGDTQDLLDLGDRVVDVSGYDERGLLGLALHPEFAENGRLFVRYSAPHREGTPSSYSHTFVLAEFAVDPGSLSADPASERTIIEIPEPQGNHNAGDVVFGPEGLLYLPVGDGGAAGDQGDGHVEDWYEPVPGGNGQDVTENLLGSLLRIDVDGEPTEHPRTDDGAPDAPDGDEGYAIPPDNPLVGEEGLDEHYAWGFRNPWGPSFGPDGRLFQADVGQDQIEEVNLVESGGNYGWNVREGTACFQADECPTVTPDGQSLRPPIVQYTQEGGQLTGAAVVGGHVYDGSAVPDLEGLYVFGDWNYQGRLYLAREADEGRWPTDTAPITSGEPGQFLLTIGRDSAGELVIGTSDTPGVGEPAGAIYRITAP